MSKCFLFEKEPRREVPKPIVWNSGPSTQAQQQQQQQQQQQTAQMFQQQANTGGFRIRRPPIGQQQNQQLQLQLQQQQIPPTPNMGNFSNQQANSPNYFQQEMQMQQLQQLQQQQAQQRFNNQFALNNQANAMQPQQQQPMGITNQQISLSDQVISLSNPQMGQQRVLNRGGQTVRNIRGGNVGRGGRANQNFQG